MLTFDLIFKLISLRSAFALALASILLACQAENPKLDPSKAPARYGSQIEQSAQGLSSAALPGGDTTHISLNPLGKYSADALSKPAANLNSKQRGLFTVGNSFFSNPWVSAPASTAARDGLGPLFNAAACQDCHIRDGRGHAPPDESAPLVAAVIRIATAGGRPDPIYGTHIQTRALPGLAPEATVQLAWRPVASLQGKIDWASYLLLKEQDPKLTLTQPEISLTNWQYGAANSSIRAGIRVAPQMIGLGLLEAIPEADILAEELRQQSLPQIEGVSNWVKDSNAGTMALGRFGWKASQPSVRQQVLDAFNNDIGITSHTFPNDACTAAQQQCRAYPNGGDPELPPHLEDAIVFYSRHLAPPSRREIERDSLQRGEALFQKIGCASCHKPSWTTGNNPDESQLSNQVIWPYTDMLLHDMGPDLADGIEESKASGQHWRTAPLWASGHARPVGGPHAGYLHDGRAKTIGQAILWHGGEASDSRDRWMKLVVDERRKLVQFVGSL